MFSKEYCLIMSIVWLWIKSKLTLKERVNLYLYKNIIRIRLPEYA